MENKKIIMVSVLVVVAMFGAIFSPIGFVGNVRAPQDMPHNIWGTASWGDDPAVPDPAPGAGHDISAWIDGVFYAGSNATTDGSSMYDLYVMGDYWGGPLDDFNKSGAYTELDDVMFFLNREPMDYYFNISNTVTTYVNGTVENIDLFFDTDPSQEGATDYNLRGLKINEIVLNPSAGPQYLYIYDPMGEIDESELELSYFLQKCDPWPTNPPDPLGPIFDFSANPDMVENYPAGSNSYYINLTGFTLDAEDELKLVWRNPGTGHNVADGNDVIVDRVEWGDYDNYFDDTPWPYHRDWDNTSMPDCAGSLAAGQSWIRSTNGSDTDDCEFDFTIATANPRAPPPPFTVDFIAIVDSGGFNITDQAIDVGQTVTGYAAAYNYTAPGDGFFGYIVVTWTVTNVTSNATTNPGSGTSSDFYSGFFAGTATWMADDGSGHTDTVIFTVNPPTVDYITIVDTQDTGGSEILDQGIGGNVDVTGYAAGFNNTIGYLLDVSVTWSVINVSSNAETNPTSGTSSIFNSGTISGTATWTATDGTHTDTVVFTINAIPPPGGIPGAPTDLVVHKGGGMWLGTMDDLVLNWTSPTFNHSHIKHNIIYWDTDLANGFQYTNYMYFAPNSTNPGDPDWCILEGFLADSTDYAFIVRTTNDTSSQEGGMYENMTGTNVGYKYIMDLQKNPGPGTQFKWISLPYISDYQKFSDILGAGKEFADNTYIDTLVKWNFTSQRYDKAQWVPFPLPAHWEMKYDYTINPGDSLGVIITTDALHEWKIVGSYDDTLEITFQKNPGPGTQFKTASLPYHKTYQIFSDIVGPGKDFTDNTVIDTMVQWNFTAQKYDKVQWVPFPLPAHWEMKWDYTINLAPGDALGFIVTTDAAVPWTPQVMGI